jgi:hypothetical protein
MESTTVCNIKKYGLIASITLGVVIVLSLIIFMVIYLIFKKVMSPSGTFAGFGTKYRGLDSGLNVDPLVAFFYQNRELRKKVDTGTVQIDEVYFTYKSFINKSDLQNVPVDIMKEATAMVMLMESGRDFTSPETTSFRSLGMAITGMDRLVVTYLESLKIAKNKVGGTDPNQEKVFQDYMKVNTVNTGYVEGVLNAVDMDGFCGNDSNAAERMKSDLREQVGLQLQMDRADPIRYEQSQYDYQNGLSDSMAHSGKMKTAGELYKDKRFPGTAERRQIRDEPTYPSEKDYKDPNVPRPGIIGKVADVPYHYDVHAKNYTRSF